MESDWATEHLQVIRTLMERSAVYRRALAPVMIFVGILGLGASVVGWRLLKIDTVPGFVGFWGAVGAVALAGAFLLVRRQALKASEAFWSPPTRRVTQAMVPPLFAGSVSLLLALVAPGWEFLQPSSLPAFWLLLYGCALSAAGFFMQRGIKLLGWLFLLCGCGLMAARAQTGSALTLAQAHGVMGATFGGLHLAYGVYLYFTEPRGNET